MKTNIKIFAFFTFFSCVLFWPIFLGKVNLNGNLLVSFYGPWGQNLPFKNTGWDQLRMFFPFYKVTLDAYKTFNAALWNPYAFSGHPYAADSQSAVFYPLNVFGFITSQIVFWHFLRITPQILAGFFTFIYLRNLRLSKLASIFGAISFGFSPFILTWGEEVIMTVHSIIFLPLILFGIDRFIQEDKRKFLAFISLALAASFLGGYMQATIYLSIFSFAYFVLRFGKKIFSGKGFLVIAAFIFGVLIASIQIAPSAQLYFLSSRAHIPLTQSLYGFLLPIESIVTYVVPDFFGHPATWNFFRMGVAKYYEGILFVGIAALIFAVFALWEKRREKLVVFLTLALFISLLAVINSPIAKGFLRLPIPLLSTAIPNRVLFIPAFCVSVLAAIGFDIWLVEKKKKILRVLAGFGLFYLLLLFVSLVFKIFHFPFFDHASFKSAANLDVTLRNMVLPVLVFSLTAALILWGTAFVKFRKIAAILIIAIATLHIVYFASKYFSFSQRQYIFPQNPILSYIVQNQGISRSWGIDRGIFENNFASQYGIFATGGYDPLNNMRYGEFTNAMQVGTLQNFIFRADAGVGGEGKASVLLANTNRRRLMDLLGVRFVIASVDDTLVMEQFNFKKVFVSGSPVAGGLAVFENKQVQPRIFLASAYEKVSKREEIIKRLLVDNFDLGSTVILEDDSPISPQGGDGSAQVVSYKPQEVIIKTKASAPKILFISDNFYPGWKAEIDGSEVGVMRADYTFRAVPLIAGEHTVRFYFDSDAFKLGAIISGLSLMFLAVFILRKNLLTD